MTENLALSCEPAGASPSAIDCAHSGSCLPSTVASSETTASLQHIAASRHIADLGVCPQLHRECTVRRPCRSRRAPPRKEQSAQPVVDRAVRANALSPLSPRGLSGLCHTVHPVGGEHGSKKLKIALLLIDSKRVYACSSQMLSHR